MKKVRRDSVELLEKQMRSACVGLALFAGLALPLGAIAPAAAAQQANGAQSTSPSETPNISGTWERYPDPYTGDFFEDRPPLPGGEPDLKEPYATQYRALIAKLKAAAAAGKPLLNASTRCLPEGMPTIMGAVYAIEILQTPGQVTVLAEFLTQTRRIYLDAKMPPLEDISPTYNGYAVGHWEGDTLVVETRAVREDVKFNDFPRSADMKITERIRLTAPDLLEDKIVIDDPKVLNKPYAFTFGYKKSDYRIMEYICDNNHNLREDGKSVDEEAEGKSP